MKLSLSVYCTLQPLVYPAISGTAWFEGGKQAATSTEVLLYAVMLVIRDGEDAGLLSML